MLKQLFELELEDKNHEYKVSKIPTKVISTFVPNIYYYQIYNEVKSPLFKLNETPFLLNIHKEICAKFQNSSKKFEFIEGLCANERGKLHGGHACKCSLASQKIGIHHNVFYGETSLDKEFKSDNYYYEIRCKPIENIFTKEISMIPYNQKEYIFDGFILISRLKLDQIPDMSFFRYNLNYKISLRQITFSQNFTLADLQVFKDYIFNFLLELCDWDYEVHMDSEKTDKPLSMYQFMPKFKRKLEDKTEEILPMGPILYYLLTNNQPLFDDSILMNVHNMPYYAWDRLVLSVKNTLVYNPIKKPRAFRLDQIDRLDLAADTPTLTNKQYPFQTPGSSCDYDPDQPSSSKSYYNGNHGQCNLNLEYPKLIHIGPSPTANYLKSTRYQKTWKQYLKLKHLTSNKAILTSKDRKKLESLRKELEDIKDSLAGNSEKYQTVSVNSSGYHTTGIKTDIVQFALILPMLTHHIRYHRSLQYLQRNINYQFRDPLLLQKALTHPSFKPNFGTNPDHCRTTLSNCGLRHIVYGNRKDANKPAPRKRGIVTLNRIMKLKGDVIQNSYKERHNQRDRNRFDCNSRHSRSRNRSRSHDLKDVRDSDNGNIDNNDLNGDDTPNYNQVITHNERLEFLGDAVIEFLTSAHLYFMFPHIEEGGLAVYRSALVQNAHLAKLSHGLELEKFMLYAHGPDLCHVTDLEHAMANVFEALIGALFLDGSIAIADNLLGKCLFGDDERLLDVWFNLSRHPLQEDQPSGDRHWISKVPILQKLTEFENESGIIFNHIRVLARAFTLRNTGYNNLTFGHNQRLEFLGDTILQVVTSEYLYKNFPYHHEGHLSLLRSCLVNNQTQCEVCHDLGLQRFVISNIQPITLTNKDKADLLESFFGAVFVDQGLEHCRVLFKVCIVNRLDNFIENQSWNDPKSLLQQCCLTLRKMDGKEPDVPIYRVIECLGPPNNRRYKVGVYFRDNRLSVGWGRSKQQAEMGAAEAAIEKYKSIFPQFTQRRKK